jgi:hypothetical protein
MILCEQYGCDQEVLEMSYVYGIPKKLCPVHRHFFQIELENNKELRDRLLEEYERRCKACIKLV